MTPHPDPASLPEEDLEGRLELPARGLKWPSEIVRLAKVWCDAFDEKYGEDECWERLNEEERSSLCEGITAVVSAMREPSKAMERACYSPQNDKPGADWYLKREAIGVGNAWRTMIDFLLSDGSEATTTGQLQEAKND